MLSTSDGRILLYFQIPTVLRSQLYFGTSPVVLPFGTILGYFRLVLNFTANLLPRSSTLSVKTSTIVGVPNMEHWNFERIQLPDVLMFGFGIVGTTDISLAMVPTILKRNQYIGIQDGCHFVKNHNHSKTKYVPNTRMPFISEYGIRAPTVIN